MTDLAAYLGVTFTLGYLAILARLPPLVGFLVAGFVLNRVGVAHLPILDILADLGVTLLLFGIGLKLDVRGLLKREVWLTASVHLVGSTLAGAGLLLVLSAFGLGMAAGMDLGTAALIGFALAFSSTVFVVKILEQRGDSHAFYGRVAIGILIMQDIAAVIFLTASSGELPSPWAAALVLLWPATRLARRIWSHIGHGEMQSLFGVVMALVPGYLLFEALGLKGDLGALIMGMLLASHAASSELSRSLFHLKELLLVGFFVSIGFAGLPTGSAVAVALVLLVLLPVKAVGYALLLWGMRLRHRTAWFTVSSLMNFSEFGLIVIAVGAKAGLVEEEWLVVVSVAVALSFVVAALVNGPGIHLVEKLAVRAPKQDPSRLHPEDQPADVCGAEVLVLGMGRVGRSAYQRLTEAYGLHVVGIDNDAGRIERLGKEGVIVVEADASDIEMWRRLKGRENLRMVVLAMPRHGANIEAVRSLRDNGFDGPVAAVARFDDEVAHAWKYGADSAFNLYAGAGLELADQIHRMDQGEDPPQHRTSRIST